MATRHERYAESDAYFINDQHNGHGVLAVVPENSIDYGLEFAFQDDTVFPEATDIALRALKAPAQALLVQGEPGSGKSHLVDDLVLAIGAANNAPAMALSLHIIGGSALGLENARSHLDNFLRRTGDKKSLVVLDNLDYLGYKGSRRLNRARELARGFDDIVGALLENPRLITIGTVHDPEWRQNQWQWEDAELNTHATHAIEAIGGKPYQFKGALSVSGLVEVVTETWPTISEEAAESHIGKLALNEHADFFHARHVDPMLYATDPSAAIKQAEQGRESRKAR